MSLKREEIVDALSAKVGLVVERLSLMTLKGYENQYLDSNLKDLIASYPMGVSKALALMDMVFTNMDDGFDTLVYVLVHVCQKRQLADEICGMVEKGMDAKRRLTACGKHAEYKNVPTNEEKKNVPTDEEEEQDYIQHRLNQLKD